MISKLESAAVARLLACSQEGVSGSETVGLCKGCGVLPTAKPGHKVENSTTIYFSLHKTIYIITLVKKFIKCINKRRFLRTNASQHKLVI